MLLASHQPNYLPNLGFFYKMAHSDLFVIRSNVQFGKNDGWQRRHKIILNGKDQWLTVPVQGSSHQQVRDIRIDNNSPWRRKHARALLLAYNHTADRAALEQILAVYDKEWDRLTLLNFELIRIIRDILGIPTAVNLDEDVTGEKEKLFSNLCEKYAADAYLSGVGGKLYMTEKHYEEFEKAGIELRFVEHDLTSMYPYSAIHYLFTEGAESVRKKLHLPVRAAMLAP